jgi:hypothetical protein
MALTQVVTDLIQDDAITYAKLGSEYTTSTTPQFDSGTGIWTLDFSSAQIFDFNIPDEFSNVVEFANAQEGMIKDIIVSGFDPANEVDYGIILPTGNVIAGTYDGLQTNLIQVLVTGPGVYWYTISQIQS